MTIEKLQLLWRDLPECIGVYMISTPSKEYYYGYSKNIKRRIREHCSQSVSNRHANKNLQKLILQHGTKCKIEIVHICNTTKDAVELENQYINMFYGDSKNLNRTKALVHHEQRKQTSFLREERKDIQLVAMILMSRVYKASKELTLGFVKMGVTKADQLRQLIINCNDPITLSCKLKFYLQNRWFSSYESCQDETGFTYSQINKHKKHDED
jgi:predicted GIY-YIG superfamily endonuclease